MVGAAIPLSAGVRRDGSIPTVNQGWIRPLTVERSGRFCRMFEAVW